MIRNIITDILEQIAVEFWVDGPDNEQHNYRINHKILALQLRDEGLDR